jgi:hypothetical protein
MAKCFCVVGQGVPVRMSDADAFEVVVRDRDGEYCPKHVWKSGDRHIARLVTDPKGHRVSESGVTTLQTHHQHKRRA